MRHLPPPVATLLATLLLPGCEAPEAPVETEPAPVVRETIVPEEAPTPAPASAPASAPAPVQQQGDAQPAVEQRTTKPLKLTIDNDSHAGQPADTFGHVPEPGWLGKSPAGGGMEETPASDKLLPDLFESQGDKKPVSVEGKILTDDGSDGASTALDGAGVNIQIPTD